MNLPREKNPQGHKVKPDCTPSTAISTFSTQATHVGLADSVDGTSSRLITFSRAVHQELQEPVHLEARNCGTLLFVSGSLRGAIAQGRGDPKGGCKEGSIPEPQQGGTCVSKRHC